MRGILFAQMDAPADQEAEFHDWYDSEHIPDRLVIPGFVSGLRYEMVGTGPRWMVIYEVDDMAAFEHPDYLRLRTHPSERTATMLASLRNFTRFTCEQQRAVGAAGGGEYVGVEAFVVDSEVAKAFEADDDRRLEALLERPDRLAARRYRVREGAGGDWTHLITHHLVSPSAGWAADSLLEGSPTPAATWLYRRFTRQ